MGRSKFIIGGVVILAAVIYLIVSATQANAEYFMTIDELKAQGQSVLGQEPAGLGRGHRRHDPIRSSIAHPELSRWPTCLAITAK